MVLKANKTKISKYLHRHNYFEIFQFLTLSLDNIKNRTKLLEKDIKEIEKKMEELPVKVKEKLDKNPDAIVSHDPNISSLIKDIHYEELEIILKINILVELLALYYHFIRTDFTKLPTSVGKRDFPKNKLYKEFDYFKDQKPKDVWENFKYPNVDSFIKLSNNDRKTLKQLLAESAKNALEAFKEIYKFQDNFRCVYNKYKHNLSEITGLLGYDKSKNLIQSHIYIRDKENNKICSYTIPVTPEAINYFYEIGEKTYNLLRVLIDNILLYIVNEEKDFLPRTLFIEKKDKQKYETIVKKVTSCVMPEIREKLTIKAPGPKEIKRIAKAIQEDFIFKLNRDIKEIKKVY